MGERADQIAQQIYQTRNELGENFSELEQKVKGAFDWRTQMEERPVTMLAVALGGGMLLSALLRSLSSRNEDNSASRTTGNARDLSRTAHMRGGQKSKTFDALKGALVGVVANRIGGIVGDLVSGYRREVQRANQQRTASSASFRPSQA
jgi:hypothetical protein